MIDSVTIHISQFVIYSDEFFTKARYQELKGKYGVFGRHATRFTDYPQRCKAEGRYFPQVHLIENSRRRKGSLVPTDRQLVVQVSLPKLVFGTSIFDLDERLLPIVAKRLVEALHEIKVGVTAQEILNAVVHRVDYSKILQISPSFGTTGRVLHALAPYDLKQSSDFNRSHYHEGKDGFYLKFYNSSQGLVIYDKFDEIVANGKTNLEQAVARAYQAGKWKKGALRIELSLQKKQTVDAVLRRHYTTKKKDFTLNEVARTDVARPCLVKTFTDVYLSSFSRLVRLGGLKETKLVRVIKDHVDDFRDRTVLYYLAHRVRALGLKATVEELKRETSPATVGRYKRAIETVLAKAEAKKDIVGVVPYLHRKLVAFKPVLPKNLNAILNTVADVGHKV